jgi:glycosyltransferase involved in cell wall biosynthesis
MKIVQYLGDSPWGDVTPKTLQEQGMGGRETALVQLAENWAQQGHEVINFVPVEATCRSEYLGGPESPPGESLYINSEMTSDYLMNFPSDVIVSWEEPRIFIAPEIRELTKLKIVEMQVAHLQVQLHEHAVNCDDFIDGYAALSPWAADFLVENEPAITPEKISILPNGIDITRYPDPPRYDDAPGPPPYRFFYSSSPDRGLHHLLRLWPRVLERWPGSTLHIAYGAERWINQCKWLHNMQAEMALYIENNLKQPGVHYLGKIGQVDLAKLQKSCHALLYTCDTLQPTETGCITAIEAMAAGAVPILTECDCLPSEFEGAAAFAPLPFDDDAYLEAMSSVLDDPTNYQSLQFAGRNFAEERSWHNIAQQWSQWFEASLN